MLRGIVLANPTTISSLLEVSGIGQRIADTYGANIIALCRSDASTESNLFAAPASPKPTRAIPTNTEPVTLAASARNAERPSYSDSATTLFHRTRTTPSDPAADLTPDQQLLDQRLRDWRKAESARIGLPQFFVLGSSTLRSIVLARPRTVAQLQTINGIGPDKAAKFGSSIVELCNA